MLAPYIRRNPIFRQKEIECPHGILKSVMNTRYGADNGLASLLNTVVNPFSFGAKNLSCGSIPGPMRDNRTRFAVEHVQVLKINEQKKQEPV